MINSLILEENDVENKSEVHNCPYCDKTSHSRAGIKTHITKIHKLQNMSVAINEESIAEEAQKVVENILDSIIQLSDAEDEDSKNISIEEISDGEKGMKYQKKCDICEHEVKAEKKYLVVQQLSIRALFIRTS